MPGKETRILSVTTLSSESSRGTARRASQVGAPAIAPFLGPTIEIVCNDALRTACVAVDCHVHCLLPNWRMDDMPGRLANQVPVAVPVAVPPERDAFRARIPSDSPGFAPVSGPTHSRNRPHRAPRPGLTPNGNLDGQRPRIPTPHRFTPAQSPRRPNGNVLHRIGFDYRLSRPVFSARRRRRESSVGRSAGQP